MIVEYNLRQPNVGGEVPETSYFTVSLPQPGISLTTHDLIEFTGTASDKVAKVIAEVGPGGPFKIGDVSPESNKWCFTQSLVTPGVSRPFSFKAFDSNGNFLQKIDFQLTLTAGSARATKLKFEGNMSTLGGANDHGMARDEGLALVQRYEELPAYFLRPPSDDEGLGRLLNPQKYYLACRWNYGIVPKSDLVKVMAKVTNPRNGKFAEAKPVDWGPHERTGRVADLSPGVAEHLGLETDDICTVELYISET